MIGNDLPVICHRIVLLISNNKIYKQDFLTNRESVYCYRLSNVQTEEGLIWEMTDM